MSSRPLAGLKVLLVEDEPLIAIDHAQKLTDAGAVIVGPCATGRQAMNHCRCSRHRLRLGRWQQQAATSGARGKRRSYRIGHGLSANSCPPPEPGAPKIRALPRIAHRGQTRHFLFWLVLNTQSLCAFSALRYTRQFKIQHRLNNKG